MICTLYSLVTKLHGLSRNNQNIDFIPFILKGNKFQKCIRFNCNLKKFCLNGFIYQVFNPRSRRLG